MKKYKIKIIILEIKEYYEPYLHLLKNKPSFKQLSQFIYASVSLTTIIHVCLKKTN